MDPDSRRLVFQQFGVEVQGVGQDMLGGGDGVLLQANQSQSVPLKPSAATMR
jgi:hypothetical protein